MQWDEGAGATLNDKTMLEGMRAGAAGDKVLPLNPTGDAEAAIKGGDQGREGRVRDAAALALADGADELHRVVP